MGKRILLTTATKIYSDRCWMNNQLQPATLILLDGKIAAIDHSRHNEAEDVSGNILMPGIIDAHVHINEPGRTEWEGFDTATLAAAAGGTTTVVEMPLNAHPVTTTAAAYYLKQEAAKNKLHVNAAFYGGLVPGNLDELDALMQAGVVGIKCFLTHSGIEEFPNVTEADLDKAMPLIARYGLPLLVHCELDGPCDHRLATHPTSYNAYLASRPRQWENEAVAMMIRLCRKHQCRVHIVHVSSAEALPLIAAAKKKGLPLTAETCAHYLYFSAEGIPDGSCIYKCAPPIREKENNDRLKQALLNGVLDFITTDHSPAPPAIKEMETGNLQKAWGGIAGIQFILPASWTALKEIMPLEKFIPLLTSHPAVFLGMDKSKGKIEVGADADLIVWSPEEAFAIAEQDILFRHKISPYTGHRYFGKIKKTIVNGVTVYDGEKIIHKNAGLWLSHL